MGPFPLTSQIQSALYAGWTDQNSINQDWAANGASKYNSYIQNGGAPLSTDSAAVAIANQATTTQAENKYQQGINTAVGGLQTQQTNLATQYGNLLSTVTGEYQPLINTATAGANENLAARGITNNSPYYTSNVTSALQPIYGSEAGNAQAIGEGSISDYNTLAQAIAGIQAGGAGTLAQLPLQYGQLQQQQALNIANIANIQQQATTGQYIAGPNSVPFNTNTGQLASGVAGIPSGGQVTKNAAGQYILNIP